MSTLPIGPEVDTTPRPVPPRTALAGDSVTLEPLSASHAPELWQAAAGAGDSWTYMGYGPFADAADFARFLTDFAAKTDAVAWAVRPVSGELASGWLTLMDIQPGNAVIELGNIWFAPRLQRTRAATEAMFLPLDLAASLGYRRLVWKCNALNAPSRRAAERLGFVYEGTLRAHLVVKGRRRDTAYFSILDTEWPQRRARIRAWLDAGNFAPDGTARTHLRAGDPAGQ